MVITKNYLLQFCEVKRIENGYSYRKNQINYFDKLIVINYWKFNPSPREEPCLISVVLFVYDKY